MTGAFAEFVRLAWAILRVSLLPPCPHRLRAGFSDLEVFADTVVWDGTDLCLDGPAVLAAVRFLAAHPPAEAGTEPQTALVLSLPVAGRLIRQGVVLAARSVEIVREIRTAVEFRRA